jgi:DNA uptake protein ComE-like DNA-binding protein
MADKEKSKGASKDTVFPISINKATKMELEEIPGIGSFFAKEISKLRKASGGFLTHEPLLTIYNMEKEDLVRLKPYLLINPKEINRININTASEERLRNHPLITYDIAHSIVFYRENYSKYKSLDELLLSPFIEQANLKELTPYLRVK